MPDQIVLYEWFMYCKDDFIPDLFKDQASLPIDNIAYQQLKEEQIEALKFKLDFEGATCDICYREMQGHEKFLIFSFCQHYFCKECLSAYCDNLISSGAIDKLVCPSSGVPSCKT